METKDKIKSIIERVERLEAEKAVIAEDIKEIYAEAKAFGLDTKALKQIVKIRKMDEQQRKEQQEILELYLSAIGME